MSKTATLSAFEHHYLKLLVTPRSPAEGAGQPIDRATLHVLLQRSMQESFGTVGAGAIAASPEGIEPFVTRFPKLRIITAFIDVGLDEKK